MKKLILLLIVLMMAGSSFGADRSVEPTVESLVEVCLSAFNGNGDIVPRKLNPDFRDGDNPTKKQFYKGIVGIYTSQYGGNVDSLSIALNEAVRSQITNCRTEVSHQVFYQFLHKQAWEAITQGQETI